MLLIEKKWVEKFKVELADSSHSKSPPLSSPPVINTFPTTFTLMNLLKEKLKTKQKKKQNKAKK